MTFSEEQVEWIVTEVIRRLGLLSSGGRLSAGMAGDERSDCAGGRDRDLAIAERVVTLRSIEGRLAGVRRLVVVPRAVVTPSVRDELRVRKVELVFRG